MVISRVSTEGEIYPPKTNIESWAIMTSRITGTEMKYLRRIAEKIRRDRVRN